MGVLISLGRNKHLMGVKTKRTRGQGLRYSSVRLQCSPAECGQLETPGVSQAKKGNDRRSYER